MTPFLLWLVRLLILLLIVRLIIRGVTAMMRSRRPGDPVQMPERTGGTLVRDPQCGTYIPESRAIVVGSGGDAHYFCSLRCRDAWTAAHGRARAGVR
jgi:hypothetical protein